MGNSTDMKFTGKYGNMNFRIKITYLIDKTGLSVLFIIIPALIYLRHLQIPSGGFCEDKVTYISNN